MIVQQAFLFHLAELERQSAALNGEKVRELLAGERDVKLDRAAPLRLGGEIGHELGARRALGDVRELFIEQQVFSRKVAQKVSDDAAVVRAGGGTDRQKALDVQKQHRCRRFGHDAHIGDTARRAGEGRGVGLPRRGAGENVAVALFRSIVSTSAQPESTMPISLTASPGWRRKTSLGNCSVFAARQVSIASSSFSVTPEKSGEAARMGKKSFIKNAFR